MSLNWHNYKKEGKIKAWTQRNITLQIAGENPHLHVKEKSIQKINLLEIRRKREKIPISLSRLSHVS